jgi:hypothetical protein
MKLILGIGCSGKTGIGNKVSKANLLAQNISRIGQVKSGKFKPYRAFYLNSTYKYIYWLLKSKFFFNFSVWYFKKLMLQDIRYLNDIKYCNTDNILQVSLRSSRVIAFLFALDSKIFQRSDIIRLFNQMPDQFEKVVVLHCSYSNHLERIKKRRDTLFIYDSLIFIGEEYKHKYLMANTMFAMNLSKNVILINTDDFENAIETSIEFLT